MSRLVITSSFATLLTACSGGGNATTASDAGTLPSQAAVDGPDATTSAGATGGVVDSGSSAGHGDSSDAGDDGDEGGSDTADAGLHLSLAAGPILSLGGAQACVVGSSQQEVGLTCWGDDGNHEVTPVGDMPTAGIAAVWAGDEATCATQVDHNAFCWGDRVQGWVYDEPADVHDLAGTIETTALGDDQACVLRFDGTLACWPEEAGVSPPPGKFVALASGGEAWCALASDGSATCWGYPLGGATGHATTRPGPYVALSVGWEACGLRPDSTLDCWGGNATTMPVLPAGLYKQVAVGSDGTCAIRADDTLVCVSIVATDKVPPSGTYRTVAVTNGSLCGMAGCAISTSGHIACWGDCLPIVQGAPSSLVIPP